MKRSGFIQRKTPLLRTKKPEPHRKEHVSLAFPKPKDMKKEIEPIKVFRSGREVCNQLTKAGRDEYHSRVRTMWERQGRRCGLMISPQCKERGGRLLIEEAQFDHSYGRGMGGGKRDDRIIGEDGKPTNMAVCCWCNSLKGSRPLSDFEVEVR
jgi:hypothetical protein